MRTRKRYYTTTSGYDAGIDIRIRQPDGGVLANVFGISLYDDGSGIEQAKANAGLIVAALNAYAKRGRPCKRPKKPGMAKPTA
jgi:hypothetical protein